MANDNNLDHAPAAVWEPLTALKPWAANPRDNSKAVAEVAKSIRRFGWGAPIVANRRDGEIIAGHTRYAAAERLKLDQVPVRWLDLDPADAHALALADNKVGEVATWDDATLRQVLAELKAADESLLADTGFSDEELAALLGEVTPTVLEPEGEPPEVDAAGPVHSVPGEVYQLGLHRLMCGDSTSIDAVERLMGGERADLLLTDPPYNVAYEGGTAEKLTIQNDNMEDQDFRQFLRDVYSTADVVMKPGAVFYIWHADSEGYNFRGAAHDVGWKIRQCLIWNKSSLVLGRQDYHWKHEPCLYGWKDGAGHFWGSDRSQTTVLEFNKPSRNGEHPTMKPVELFQYQLENSTKRGDLVLDSFGGSGTTLIACAQSGRVARLMELDPRYCDVIRRRWTRWAKANGVDAGSGALDG